MRILLAEDNVVSLSLLKRQLEHEGHQVVAVTTGQQAYKRASFQNVDLLITDIQMPDWDGYKCIEALSVVAPSLPIIVYSSLPEDEIREKLPDVSGVIAVHNKESDSEELLQSIQKDQPERDYQKSKFGRIVCTIGPSCQDRVTIGRMILAGMDVARMNFSHGSHEEHDRNLRELRAAERKWSKPLAILLDLCGPKLRTGMMADGGVQLVEGAEIRICAEEVVGTAERFSTNTPQLLADLDVGEVVLLDDGLLELKVIAKEDQAVVCRVINGGLLRSRKGMNMPQTCLSLPGITAKDFEDMEWAARNDVDFVAISFVRRAEDVREVREFLRERGCMACVIAKIEKPEAVEQIDSIIAEADGIMIARGDMGVELSASRVPWIQRDILKRCEVANKPVITATQMLESMTTNSRPTRAEVTDVTVAIREGSDAVMLSGETAVGVDPVRVVRTMSQIIHESEFQQQDSIEGLLRKEADTWGQSLLAALRCPEISVTVSLDAAGERLPELSKKIRNSRLVLVTDNLATARRSNLYHGVTPIILSANRGYVNNLQAAMEELRAQGLVSSGDLIAVIEAVPEQQMPYEQLGSLVYIRA